MSLPSYLLNGSALSELPLPLRELYPDPGAGTISLTFIDGMESEDIVSFGLLSLFFLDVNKR